MTIPLCGITWHRHRPHRFNNESPRLGFVYTGLFVCLLGFIFTHVYLLANTLLTSFHILIFCLVLFAFIVSLWPHLPVIVRYLCKIFKPKRSTTYAMIRQICSYDYWLLAILLYIFFIFLLPWILLLKLVKIIFSLLTNPNFLIIICIIFAMLFSTHNVIDNP